jgi:hypothetical protein
MLRFIAAISLTVMQLVWITFCFGSFASFGMWFLLLYFRLFSRRRCLQNFNQRHFSPLFMHHLFRKYIFLFYVSFVFLVCFSVIFWEIDFSKRCALFPKKKKNTEKKNGEIQGP